MEKCMGMQLDTNCLAAFAVQIRVMPEKDQNIAN